MNAGDRKAFRQIFVQRDRREQERVEALHRERMKRIWTSEWQLRRIEAWTKPIWQ